MEPQIVIILLAAVAVGALLGWLIGRVWGGRAVAVVFGLLVLSVVWMFVQGRQSQGFDGIGYAIGAFLFASPAAVGVAIGGWAGARSRRRAMSRAAQTPRFPGPGPQGQDQA